MREYRLAHASPPDVLRDFKDRAMTTDGLRKADRPIPSRGFGKHEIGTADPIRKREEFGSPDHSLVSRREKIAIRLVRRVDDHLRRDGEFAADKAADVCLQIAMTSCCPDLLDKLTPDIGQEPSVPSRGRHRSWTAVEHDAEPSVLNQEPSRSIAWGVHGTDAKQCHAKQMSLHTLPSVKLPCRDCLLDSTPIENVNQH
jgi:hypothetical protein